MGSTTISKRVPFAAPSSAARSTSAKLSPVGEHRRRHTSVLSARSTTAAWALAIPRSSPTTLRSFIYRSFPGPRASVPALPEGRRAWPRPQGGMSPNRGSHSCAATGPDRSRPAHFPQPGPPWPGWRRPSGGRGSARESASLRGKLDASPRTSRVGPSNSGTTALSRTYVPYMGFSLPRRVMRSTVSGSRGGRPGPRRRYVHFRRTSSRANEGACAV